MRTLLPGLALTTSLIAAGLDSTVADRVLTLTRESTWTLVKSTPIAFRTFHPQGMVKIGDAFFVSSVEVKVAPRRYPAPVNGYDRDTGEGTGHLFKIDMSGRLLADLTLAEGPVYHPGGIDFDGTSIWVPLSEYRPDSQSIIYRISPATMTATAVFRYPDSIGAIVHNTDDHTLHGASWGSRRFYRWALDRNGRVTNAGVPRERLQTLNPSHYIDYQDCRYAGGRRMLCAGLADLRPTPASPAFRLGGLELVSLTDGRPLHQVPVPLRTPGGTVMTQNPMWMESSPTGGLRAYFMPEDDESTVYIYEINQ